MSTKTSIWKSFRLFVVFMLVFGNVLSLPAAALAQDGTGEDPAPAETAAPLEDETAAPAEEEEAAPPVVEEPEVVETEETPAEEEPVTILADEPVEAQATTITFTGGELLGRPTDTSITINVVPASTIVMVYEYGTSSGVYTNATAEVTATGGQPKEVVINGLMPSTRYYYRLKYHIPAESDWVLRDEHSFWTQRDEGSTFKFTVTSDSHATFNTAHQQAMINILSDQPDFNIDLGDTFFADNASSQSAVNSNYLTYRSSLYLGAIGPSVPIYLSSGNHEDEEGWNFDDTPFSTALASVQARKAYYPTPIQDGFYSANTDTLAAIDEVAYGDEYREDYYAWEWGDALFVVIDPFQYTMNLPYTPSAGEGSEAVTGDQWSWTLGETQYNWFKQTLENSDAKYKFVFSHQMLGGIPNLTISGVGPGYVRGGAGAAPYFEWGGKNADGSEGFAAHRPGWEAPIHQLMVENGVSAYFHGHDHQYVYEKLDGVVYQEVPSPSMSGSGFGGIYSTSNPYTLAMYPSAGHLRITITPDQATVDYVRSDTTAISYSYIIEPAGDDTTSPTVTIEQAAGQADPTSASPVNFTVTFSESVSDFATGDVTLGGTAGATTAVVTGSGTTYNVAVSGMTTSGTVIASLAAGVAHDSANNPNTASTSTDNTVTYNPASSGVVTLDGVVTNATGAANATSVSFSHTTGTGANRLLLVGISWNCYNDSRSISSVTFTYGSNTLNLSQKVLQETGSTPRRFAAIWYSPTEPPQNTAGTVTVTFSGTVSNGIVVGAANFAGVDQTTPFTSSGGANSSTTGTTQSVTLSSLTGNELVFDTVFVGVSTTLDPTVGSGQTKLWSNTISNTRGVASTEQATGSSVVMSWTTGSTAVVWASAAVAIKPAASTGTTYDLTMAVSPSGGGTTDPAVGVHTYAEGTVVPITATPADGYEFDSWTGDVANAASASTTVTMNANKTVTANFTEISTGNVVTLDGVVNNATGAANATSVNFSHTTGAGTNRLLLVGSSWNCGNTTQTITSVTFTYGSNTLNLSQKVLQETGSQTKRFAAIWYSPTEPPQNTAGTVTVTFSGTVSNGIVVGAANFAGVDQTMPFTNFNGANSSSTGTTQSVTLNSLTGDELVFDTVFIGASTPPNPTVGSGQTALWTNTVSNTRGVASIEQAAGSSVVMSWSTGSTAVVWASAAVAIKPAASTVPTHDLTMAVSPSGGGTTSPAAGTHTYDENEVVNISAAPAAGYVFDHWSGACSGTGACQVTMTGDLSVTAHFNFVPVLASIGNRSINELTLLNFTASGTDTDPLTYSLQNGSGGLVPAGASIDSASGVFNWTPTETQGPGVNTFDVCVSDGSESDCETIAVTVNEVNVAPVLSFIGPKSVARNATLNFTATATDADKPDNTLAFSLAAGSGGAVPSGATINPTSGAFTWTPAAVGDFTFDVCVNDGLANDCETITVTVTEVTYTISGNAGVVGVTLAYDGGSVVSGTGGAYNITVAAGWSGTVTPSLSGYKFTPSNRTYSNVQASEINQDYSAEISVPPDLPSSFQGEIHISDGAPVVGDPVDVLVEGVSGVLISTNIINDEGILGYSINVPADVVGTPAQDGGTEGDEVTFQIGGRLVAKGVWHGGTNVRLDFHPPQANPGGPYTGTAGNAVSFSGSAIDWGNDHNQYEWDWDNDGVYDTTAQNPSHTWSSTGSYTVGLKVTDAQGGVGTATAGVTINTAAVTVTLENLNQTYDGNPKPVSVTTNPAGLSYSITYNGGATVPTNANSYAVVVTITDPGYTGGNSGTLVIAKAASVTAVTGGSFTYDGAAHAATVSVTGAGGLSLTPAPLYAGTCSAAPVSVAESTSCTASYSYAGDANHEGSSDSDGIVISKKTASVIPNAAGKEYGGGEPALSGDLSGFVAGDGISAVYSRTTGETVAGSPYTISAVLSPAEKLANYDITYHTANFTISKKAASVTPNTAGKAYNTADPELTGVLSGFLTADTVTAEYSRTAGETVAGSPYTISAELSPAGVLGNYDITYNTADFTISKAAAGVNLTNLNQVYDGSPKPATVTTVPGGLSVTVTYNGSSTAPSDPGSYAVIATVNDANYSGSASGTLVISALHSVALTQGWNLVSFLVHPDSTAIASVLSTVEGSYDLVYAWDAAAGGWKKYDNVPASPDDLTALDEKQGFWIHMTAADTLEVTGTLPTSTNIALSDGWNLVGYPKATSGALPGILSSNGVDEANLLVYAYHVSDTADPWKVYDRSGLPFGNDLTALTPGWGYWIEVAAVHTWSVPY